MASKYFAICLLLLLVAAPLEASSLSDVTLELEPTKGGKYLRATLHNSSPKALRVYWANILAGRGFGNVHWLVLSSRGQNYPACMSFLQREPLDRVTSLPPRGERVLFDGSVTNLEMLHCLPPDKYTVMVIYRTPEGDLITSDAVDVEMGHTRYAR